MALTHSIDFVSIELGSIAVLYARLAIFEWVYVRFYLCVVFTVVKQFIHIATAIKLKTWKGFHFYICLYNISFFALHAQLPIIILYQSQWPIEESVEKAIIVVEENVIIANWSK